jgi:hypothetical protein
MSNPYQSPNDYGYSGPHYASPAGSSATNATIVKVKVLAILMTVQGALEALLGLMLGGIGIVFYMAGEQIFAAQQQQGLPRQPGPPDWMYLIYVVLGGVLLVVAALRIYAGACNLRFRGKLLGIIAISVGAVSSLTCYCAPTAIGLLIYGLIVYLDANVSQAFSECEAGIPAPG